MNWVAIRLIYYNVLVCGNKIEYLGEDRFKLTSFHSNGKKFGEVEYKNEQLHGKSILWWENGNKYDEVEFKNEQLHGRSIGWRMGGTKCREIEYKDGVWIKDYIKNES